MQAHAAFLSGSAALPRPATQRQARTQRQGRAATHVMAYMTKEHSSANLQQSVLRLHEAMNKHDITQLSHFLAPAVVLSDRVWSSIDVRGIVKVRRIYQELWTAYPDYSVHVEDVLARDDSHTVAVHFTATGTNFGEWRGNPASGRRTTMSGMSLFVFEPEGDDQIKQIITYRQPSSEEYILYLGHEDL